jgi:hypothetical protein
MPRLFVLFVLDDNRQKSSFCPDSFDFWRRQGRLTCGIKWFNRCSLSIHRRKSCATVSLLPLHQDSVIRSLPCSFSRARGLVSKDGQRQTSQKNRRGHRRIFLLVRRKRERERGERPNSKVPCLLVIQIILQRSGSYFGLLTMLV